MTKGLKEIAVGNLQLHQDDAFEFFAVYARYEYAAKACNLVHVSEHSMLLTIDPQAVANRVRGSFLAKAENDEALQGAISYYTVQPPMRQIWNGVGPAWDQPVYQGNDKLKKILLQLAQARNNQFHGGKGWKPDSAAIGRDNDLLRHGLVILGAVVNSDDQLLSEFSSFS